MVYNHLYYLQKDSYKPEMAARSFDLPAEEAEKMAIKLKQILDGKGYYLDLNIIPRKRTYYDSARDAHLYVITSEEPAIYVERQGDDWFYSKSTVEAIPALFNETYPFGANLSTYFAAPFWKESFLTIELWQWLCLLILVGIFVVCFMVFGLLFRPLINLILKSRLGKRLLRKIPGHKVSRLLGLILATRLSAFLLPMIELPPKLHSLLLKGLGILTIFFVIFLINQLVNMLFKRFEEHAESTESTLDDQLIPVLKPLIKFFIWFTGLIFIFIQLEVNITALLAGVSIGGLALALAAQDTVKNFFGSVMIFLDKPFQIGDWIHFEGVDGTVEQVGIRGTRLRTFENSVTYIPNGKLADSVVNNMGLRLYRRYKTDIGVTYDTPPALIDEFVIGIREIITEHPLTRTELMQVHLNSFGPSSLNILLYCFFETMEWRDELEGKHEIMTSIIRLAEELGVRFAFPTQTLHIEEFPEKKLGTPESMSAEQAKKRREEVMMEIKDYIRSRRREGGN